MSEKHGVARVNTISACVNVAERKKYLVVYCQTLGLNRLYALYERTLTTVRNGLLKGVIIELLLKKILKFKI